MAGFLNLLGLGATITLIILLWKRRRPGRSIVSGVVLGLLAALLWPVTLWIAIGLWWYWRGQPSPRSAQVLDAKIREARAFAQQAELDGLPAQSAYWKAEAERLAAQVEAMSA